MRVLIYAPLAILSHHFETDLELYKKHVDAGDDVTVVFCGSRRLKDLGYAACYGLLRCHHCRSKAEEAIQFLKIPKEKIRYLPDLNSPEHDSQALLPEITTEKLLNFKYKGSTVGASVFATLITSLRNSEPDLNKKENEIRKMLSVAMNLYDACVDLLQSEKPDLVYLFNGRLSLFRPMVDAARAAGIRFALHERAGALDRYTLSLNTDLHDLPKKKQEVLSFWQNSSVPEGERIEIAQRWYESRRAGRVAGWHSFSSHQNQGALPSEFSEQKRNISIFVSSDDELVSNLGWDSPLFGKQRSGIEYILEAFRERPEFHFFLRIHPNLAGIRNPYTRALTEFSGPNITVISADDKIDSYRLMMVSEKVVVFSSTVAVEANYFGTPALFLGRNVFEDLGSLYVPKSREEVVHLLESKLEPKDKLGCYIYAFWLARSGRAYDYYKPITLSRGTFLGQSMIGSKMWHILGYAETAMINFLMVLRGELSFATVVKKITNKFAFFT